MNQDKTETIFVDGEEFAVTPEVKLAIELVQQTLDDLNRFMAMTGHYAMLDGIRSRLKQIPMRLVSPEFDKQFREKMVAS
jgi:hypothetical protein